MLYLANASSPKVRDAMLAGELGQLVTPNEGRRPLPGVEFGADNGCFSKNYVGDDRWLTWLDALPRQGCLFATAPDVVADAAATMARSLPWLPRIQKLGFPAAFVAQDGLEDLDIPWDEFDALFIGGSTEWKLSEHARLIAVEAKQHGKLVHMGRVNSALRWGIAEFFGCDSCDGTFLAFGPDTNLPKARAWWSQGSLFSQAGAV